MAPWMINCKEHSELISKGLDRPLSFWDKVLVKMHSWICPACDQVKKQLMTIGNACRFVPADTECEQDASCVLPDDACARMKAALKKGPQNQGR